MKHTHTHRINCGVKGSWRSLFWEVCLRSLDTVPWRTSDLRQEAAVCAQLQSWRKSFVQKHAFSCLGDAQGQAWHVPKPGAKMSMSSQTLGWHGQTTQRWGELGVTNWKQFLSSGLRFTNCIFTLWDLSKSCLGWPELKISFKHVGGGGIRTWYYGIISLWKICRKPQGKFHLAK